MKMMCTLKKIRNPLFIFLFAVAVSALAAKEEARPVSGENSPQAPPAAGVADQTAPLRVQPPEVFLPPASPGIAFDADRMHQRHRRIMRRMMEEFFADPFDDRPGHCPSPFISRRHFNPECDLKEKSGSYELTLEVPGMSGGDLKITVSRSVLTVSGEKKEVRETETADCRTGERCYGAFRRSFSLPGGTDIDGIRAKCKDGVLTVIIPKPAKSPEEVKTIPVES